MRLTGATAFFTLLLSCCAGFAEASSMTPSRVQSFMYLITANTGAPGIFSSISNSPADLIILGQGAGLPALNRALADPTGSKLIFGYIDATEASPFNNPDLFKGATKPNWFGKENLGFPGVYTVQYWNPNWQKELFQRISDQISQGFDGVFLDVLGGDGEWLPGNPFGNPAKADATKLLETLVANIRSHIKTLQLNHPFYLIGNNPTNIAQDNPATLLNLDILFNENGYFISTGAGGVLTSNPSPHGYVDSLATLANIYNRLSIPVLGNDYPQPFNSRSEDVRSFALYSALGWLPSVVDASDTLKGISKGPFMATAVAQRPEVQGSEKFTNYLSGGQVLDATLVGGDKGDYFIGGPGKNKITGGSGNDLIYAHPANAGLKHEIQMELINTATNKSKNPSLRVVINGTVVIHSLPITENYYVPGYAFQKVVIDAQKYEPIRKLEIDGLGIYYNSAKDFNNLFIESILYQGQSIPLSSATYAPGSGLVDNGRDALLNAEGFAIFSASVFAKIPSPFPSDTRDVIDGGGGLNTVVYRGNSAGYSITTDRNRLTTVTSLKTAEGPDLLRNVQKLVFSDKQISIP